MQRGGGVRRRGAVDRDQGRARRHPLPWTPFAHDVEEPKRGAAFQKPMAVKLGVFRPITVYPLYESATSAHSGQTPREALAEVRATLVDLCGRRVGESEFMAEEAFTPEEITTPTPENRLIAWPYTKLMVANPTVNMGGAILMTSLAKARAAGVPEDRLIYPLGGASAEEPRDYLVRDQFYESHPQNAVLKAVMDLVEGDGKKFDAIELYSCFPCVPKMARRTLGLGPDVKPTVTGGLTFFGAPLNTYMTHAAARWCASCAPAARSACSTARAVLSPSIMAWCCRGRRRKRRSRRTPASRPRPTAARARCRNSSPRPQARARSRALP